MICPQFPDEIPAAVSTSTLRQFAGLCLGVFGLLFALSWYRHAGEPTVAAWIAAGAAIVVGLPGLFYPALVRPIYLGAMAVTQPIGHAVSMVLLGVVYFCFLTPLAMIFRLAGRDVLMRRPRNLPSYWAPALQPSDVRRYLRQYQSQQMKDSDTQSEVYHGASELNPR